MDINFQEAVKSVLAKLSLKSLKEGQRNAVEGYLSGQYLFVYLQSGFFIFNSFWRRTAVRTECVIIELLVNLMNGQVSSLQRNCLAANLHWPFYRVRSNRRWIPMNVFREQRIYSLPFIATSILNNGFPARRKNCPWKTVSPITWRKLPLA